MQAVRTDEHGKLVENADLGWFGKVGRTDVATKAPEAITGPVALREQVLVYQEWERLRGDASRQDAADSESAHELQLHPALQPQRQRFSSLDVRHGLRVFDPSIIYPFTWDTSVHPTSSETYQKCRLQPGDTFDPAGCHGAFLPFLPLDWVPGMRSTDVSLGSSSFLCSRRPWSIRKWSKSDHVLVTQLDFDRLRFKRRQLHWHMRNEDTYSMFRVVWDQVYY
jgi:hypothetical protein